MDEQIAIDEICAETTPHELMNGIEPSRKRKRRADAGVSRGPKLVKDELATADRPVGAINTEQKSRLLLLMALVQQTTTEHSEAKVALDEAARRMTRAASDFTAYLNSLTT